jgi:hypothetical protein
MDFDNAKKEFLAELVQKSAAGKIDWLEEADPDAFTVTFGGKYIVKTYKLQSGTVIVKISNDVGRELFQYRETRDEPTGAVWELYQSARRKALKVEEALADLLADIQRK